MLTPKEYLRWFVGALLVLVVGCTALTVIVDPYRTFGTPPIAGWTELKPRIYQEAGLAKTYQLDRTCPRTLLLGNSRVEIGIDPLSPMWPGNARPVFDAAWAGKGLHTALLMMREAISLGCLRTVVVGVDFQDFLQNPKAHRLNRGIRQEERRLRVTKLGSPNPTRKFQIWRDRFTSTLTIGAVTDSLWTLLDQNRRTGITMTVLGFNPLHEYRLFAERNGYFQMFAHMRIMYEKQYRAYAVPDFSDPAKIRTWRYLNSIIQLAQARRIRLILFTPPYHAQYLEMLHQMGLWPSFRNWLWTIASVMDVSHRGGREVEVFDCSTYDRFTSEPIPLPGDRVSKMQWYWEPGHFKRALGNEVLKAIFDRSKGLCAPLDGRDVHALEAQTEAQRKVYMQYTMIGAGAAVSAPIAAAK